MTLRAMLATGALLSVVFVGATLFGASPLFRSVLSPVALTYLASAAKLAGLAFGAAQAMRSRRAFEAGSSMRSAWGWMAGWFALFFLGQLVLTTYEVRVGAAPVPSLGDAAFVLGYAAVIVGTSRVFVGYRASGFALGSRAGDAVTAGVVLLAAAVSFVTVLAPLARSSAPLLERAVTIAYPALDFVLLVPTLLLLRMTWAFRGSRLWSVWATFLAGIACFTAGDLLFAIPGASTSRVGPLVDLLFLLGYGLAAAGASLNAAVVSE